MITGYAFVLIAIALLATGWGLVTAVANKPPGRSQLLFAGFLEVVTLVQSVMGLIRIGAGFRPPELGTTIGYLIAIVILVPVAWLWANAERTRFSGVVLAIAAVSVAAMTLRLLVLWNPGVLG